MTTHSEARALANRLRKLAEAATPGPWRHASIDTPIANRHIGTVAAVAHFRVGPYSDDPAFAGGYYDDHRPAADDAAYIAACDPATIIALCDAVDGVACQDTDFQTSQKG